MVLNAVLGDSLGDVAMAGFGDLTVQGPNALVKVKLTAAERLALLDRGKQVAGRFAPLGDAARAREHYRALVLAAEAGRLPERGSLLPYLRFALALADRRAAEQAATLPEDEARRTTPRSAPGRRPARPCWHWQSTAAIGGCSTWSAR